MYYEFYRDTDQKIRRVSGYEDRTDETKGDQYIVRCTIEYGLFDRKDPDHISFRRICQCCIGHIDWQNIRRLLLWIFNSRRILFNRFANHICPAEKMDKRTCRQRPY